MRTDWQRLQAKTKVCLYPAAANEDVAFPIEAYYRDGDFHTSLAGGAAGEIFYGRDFSVQWDGFEII